MFSWLRAVPQHFSHANWKLLIFWPKIIMYQPMVSLKFNKLTRTHYKHFYYYTTTYQLNFCFASIERYTLTKPSTTQDILTRLWFYAFEMKPITQQVSNTILVFNIGVDQYLLIINYLFGIDMLALKLY